ncbi:protein ENHANCED DOWNY MILDEW 2-like [Typha latifolia]|uniref:protein ENHANCED DOWNY MILDEW 2-like n=1 Tax=Typha latifolia TaxID=4733 RepID=UPI003C2F2440
MAMSDDEAEVMPQAVTNYYFVDREESPISFTVLPILLDGEEKLGDPKKNVFLHGTADGGLQKVYKEVTAWKLEFQGEQPEIAALSKDNKWIDLLKPRKSYEDTIWTIMITVHMLHFLKRNPEASEKRLWDHLRRVRSKFEIGPSEDDLRDHLSLIKLFVDRDETLKKCQLLLGFLEKPRRKFVEATSNLLDIKQSFIADENEVDDIVEDDAGDESEEESDLFDSVCAICDNGGEILCCEGMCMRSFHATRRAGEESDCRSLGYTNSQLEVIQTFLCKNCEYKQHQCFACGKMGSSDKSAGAEVFLCVNATCGHFYHPKCVAELLYPDNKIEESEYEKKISSGMPFTCPVHKCVICKRGEDKEVFDLQFAMCRRCPKSYHRKCLPRRISFKEIEDEGIVQRAWEDLLPNRILIYCLKHKIDEDLGTPTRNHIVFPGVPEKNNALHVQKKKIKTLVNKRRQVSDDLPSDRTSIKSVKEGKLSCVEESQLMEKSFRGVPKEMVALWDKVKPFKEKLPSVHKTERTVPEGYRKPMKEKGKPLTHTVSSTSVGKMLCSSFPVIDAETEKRIISLMEKESSSLTLEDITKNHTIPSTHAYSAKHIDKAITRGKIEGSVEAVQTALQKVDDGATVEDAKAVCEPEILKQLIKWSNKLRVYLAPFLHGMRYTSFGRHFTKVDKLKEIVNKIQWYVQAGDTIVDFCCGANDFSQIMKETLDAAGKRTNFKNYDLIQPKNDFNFEKRDWMKVQPKELPTGSQLIMGLNPPFGVKAALANKFIDKALTFKPKLIILIVPKETQRLDKKRQPYDLIWEDGESLSGKSFYLPGSIDVDDKQMEQWNLKPPLLYLWSRSDWTSRHKAIAAKHGHISMKQSDQTQEDALPREEHMKMDYDQRDATLKESRKEDNKNAEPHKKRKAPEIPKSRSHKRIKSKGTTESSEIRTDSSSDMSISSSDTRDPRDQSMGHPLSEPIEKPLESVGYQGSYSRFGTESGLIPIIRPSGLREGIDEMDRSYNTPSIREDYISNPHDLSAGGSNSRDNTVLSLEPRHSDDIRGGSIDPFRRSPYFDDSDAYGRPSRPDLLREQRLYSAQGEEDGYVRRNSYSVEVPDTRFGQPSSIPSSSYGLPTSSAGTSAIDRYVPRLDETNYTGAANLAPGAPHQGASGMYDMPGMRRDMPPETMGFGPRLPHPYPRPGSSGGWLNQ